MGSIRLNPADAARYGVGPEGVPFDLANVGVRQRAALVREAKRSWNWFIDQLGGVPELDEHGNPIPVPVLDDDGNPVLEADGTPKVRMKLTQDGDVLAMLVWLALWGAGIRVPWDTFDVLSNGLEIDLSDGEAEEPGKADEPKTSSANTTSDPS